MISVGSSPPTSFTLAQQTGVVALMLGCAVIVALQPLLLGALAAQGRLSVAQIGEVATAEALGMAVSSSLAGAKLAPERLKLVAGLASLVLLGANLLSITASGALLLLIRAIGGLSSGVIVWLFVGMIARSVAPARLVGIMQIGQGVISVLLATLLSTILIPRFGGGAGYGAISLIAALMLCLTALIPARYVDANRPRSGSGGLLPLRGIVGLAAVFFHLAAILGFWVYALPIGRAAGLSEAAAGLAVSLAVGCQIAGGCCVVIFATRPRPWRMMRCGFVAGLAGLVGLYIHSGTATFLVAMALFGFFWSFSTAFHMPFLLLADPGRRTAMQLMAVQLFGISVGPLLASVALDAFGVGGVLAASAIMLVAAAVLTELCVWYPWRRSDMFDNELSAISE